MSSTDDVRIKPWAENPRYWQYKGKPVLLLGGTREDNLYQIPDLEEHLNLLKSVGGNYIRNTMSCRDDGDVWMFRQLEDGKYDLDQWNDEHWARFEKMLKLTAARDIFVQIELWAFHDFNAVYGCTYERNPWRPVNNINYTAETCTVSDELVDVGKKVHSFFCTVPALNNDESVLKYQRKFVDKLLSISLEYDHVLYCMTNEIHPDYSPEWGWYWSRYIQEKAAAAGKRIETTEMFWQIDLKHEQHRPGLDHPEIYSFFEASQNSAKSGSENRDNFQFVYDYLAEKPRPLNNVKIYGATVNTWEGDTDDKALARFWHAVLGGCASARFHRPDTGLGLTLLAQAHIKSMRMLTDEMDMFNCRPMPELMTAATENSCSVFGRMGKEYAVYLPPGETVSLDLTTDSRELTLRWLDIAASEWKSKENFKGGSRTSLKAPGDGHWAVLIK